MATLLKTRTLGWSTSDADVDDDSVDGSAGIGQAPQSPARGLDSSPPDLIEFMENMDPRFGVDAKYSFALVDPQGATSQLDNATLSELAVKVATSNTASVLLKSPSFISIEFDELAALERLAPKPPDAVLELTSPLSRIDPPPLVRIDPPLRQIAVAENLARA